MDRHRRVYQRLLIAYPAEYRREYGEPMTQLFTDRMRDEGGGAKNLLLWVAMIGDLMRTAFTERLETTMKSLKTDWWRVLALPLSLLIVIAAIGNLIEDSDGALFGRVAYLVASGVGFALVIAGLIFRRKDRMMGSTMIAIGVMPAFPLVIMFWLPPVALVGVLGIAISLKAFIDAPKAPRSMIDTA